MSLTEFSLKRPVTTIMFFVSMVVIGLVSAVRLPLEQLPDISFPFVGVSLGYQGSTPEETEVELVRPTEEALSTIPGIKSMEASATSEGAFVGIFFKDWSKDISLFAAEAREKMDAIRDQLPDDFQRFTIVKFSTSDQPVLRIRLAGEGDLSRRYEFLDQRIRKRIERVDGVARVTISGAMPNEVEISVYPDRLTANGLTLASLANRLQATNFSISGGVINDGGMRYRIQPLGEIRDLDEYRNLVLNSRGVKLSDIADVELKPARLDSGRRINGKPAIGIDVFKSRDANLVNTTRAVLKEIDSLGTDPDLRGIDIKVVGDQGADVTKSLTDLAEAGLIGLILSTIVLFFFLRHWPSTLMVSTAIPICFVMTLGFMYFAGLSLNVLTMMGLLLAVGMLVDNAVVVVESIYQERERMPGDPQRAAVVGTRNVAIALSAGTLCHCIVFVPNLFGDRNQISIFMSQIAITISVSLLASWLVAISLIPMLAARMKTPPAVHQTGSFIHRMQERYARFLRWTLEHRGASVLGILLIVVISFVPMALTKVNMFNDEGGQEVDLNYEFKGTYTKDQISAELAKAERFLQANADQYSIKQIYAYYQEGGGAFGGSSINLTFKDGTRETTALAQRISKELPPSAIAKISVRGGGDTGGGQSNIQVHLTGNSMHSLKELSADLLPILGRIPSIRDLREDNSAQTSEMTVSVDRDRAASFGLSAEEVSRFIGLALRGSVLRSFQQDANEVPVWVRFKGSENRTTADLAGFNIITGDGRTIPLTSVVRASIEPTATAINRQNRQTTLTLTGDLAPGSTVPEARKALEDRLKAVAFPPGYGYNFEGSAFEREDEAQSQMFFNLLLALLMIYVVMAAVFESLLFPSAIMSCVVFSVLGVFWLFMLTGTTFSLMAFIGILVLMGVVVNNGIVMIEHINNLRRRGMSRTDALVEGSRERLRPILMTMGTAILAMVPLSIQRGGGSGNGIEYFVMARAIAGGLTFSTIVSLLFLPTIYAILDDMGQRNAHWVERAKGWRRPSRERTPSGA